MDTTTVDARKVFVCGCPDPDEARIRYRIPADMPYLGLWRNTMGQVIHLFSTSPPDVFAGWGWTRPGGKRSTDA